MADMTETLARRAVERTVADRQDRYERELRLVIDSTYDLIERSGTLDPSLREILAHAGLSTQAFYRYFRSKDELLLVLLDDGRRQLVEYLTHRMEAADAGPDKVRAWVEGVLAQASDPKAAARSRPFVANEDRLAQMFPVEQQASVDGLVDLLDDALGACGPTGGSRRPDAEAIFRLTFATLRSHLMHGSRPTTETVGHLTGFCLRGAGIVGEER